MKQNRNVATTIQPSGRDRSTPPPRASAPPHEGRSVFAAAAPNSLPHLGRDDGEMALYLVRWACPSTPAPSSQREEGNEAHMNQFLAVFYERRRGPINIQKDNARGTGNDHATPLGVSLSLSETVGVGRHHNLCHTQEPTNTLPLDSADGFVKPLQESSNHHQRGEQWA